MLTPSKTFFDELSPIAKQFYREISYAQIHAEQDYAHKNPTCWIGDDPIQEEILSVLAFYTASKIYELTPQKRKGQRLISRITHFISDTVKSLKEYRLHCETHPTEY